MHSLGKTLLAFALLRFVLQGQICLLLQVSLDSVLFIAVPYDVKDIFVCVCMCVCVLVLEGLVGLQGLVGLHRTVQLQLLQHCWLGQ